MKDQYFADFGDYQKFSLLTCLRDIGKFKLCVHWMKTKDDTSNHGSRIGYLQEPAVWRHHDPDIFSFLAAQLPLKKRSLTAYEKSAHAVGILFAREHVEQAAQRTLLLESVCTNAAIEILFFDPDNGIEVKSTTKSNQQKFVLWSELKQAYAAGKTLLVYQHFTRKNRDVFIREKLEEIEKHLAIPAVALRVKHSVYFFIPQKRHRVRLEKSLKEYVRRWKDLALII